MRVESSTEACTVFSRGDTAWLSDSGAVIAQLHQDGWIAQSESGLEILSHPMVSRVLQGKEFRPGILEALSAGEVPSGIKRFLLDGLLPAIDGERHKRIRRVLLRTFAARRIEDQRALMRSIAHRLIDSFIEDGEADLVAQFTHHYPIEVVAALIGVPSEDIAIFEQWTVAVGHFADHPIGVGYPSGEAGITGIIGYLERLMDARRQKPADDLMTTLIEAHESDQDITEPEILYNMVNLLMAGHDTTRLQLASAVHLLLTNPDQFDLLHNDMTLVSNTIEEAMRLRPAARRTFRFPREALVIDGVTLRPDKVLVANMEAANLDPNVFPDPSRFDIRRANANKNLTFGLGPHLCAGAGLARAEMDEALAIIVQRLDGLKLNGEARFNPNSAFMGGPESLPIAFRKSQPIGVSAA